MPNPTDDVERLLWCIRPAVDITHLHAPLPEKMVQQHPTAWPYREASLRTAEHHLVVTETVNQERSLAPVFEGGPRSLPPLSAGEGTEAVESEVVREVRSRLRRALSNEEPLLVAALEHRLYKAARAHMQFRRLDLSAYRGLVVATQHSSSVRAAILAAEEQGTPVTYIPHAPVAGNPVYLDLPASTAGLRGVGESDYYSRELGIPAASLDVIGNLGSDLLETPAPAIRPGAPGILALSPHPSETLERMFSLVSDASIGELIVAPHPATQLKDVRPLMRPGWQLAEGWRTMDLLTEGPAFLLHLSSGVAWESAALGIPTATIRLDQTPVNYPFLVDESVYPSIFTSSEAASFVARARGGVIDRSALLAHARRWCSFDGVEAKERLRVLLRRNPGESAESQTRCLHDGWSAGGAALARSWIASTPVAPA
ncbi:hypothetical protein [Leucobacter sp. NPDC077196]|uniref:hypothetical protein n=1 Tax=Leucobacter sp. NPDC077196 TaxID=3154959 RepID=UPI003437A439